MKSNLLKAALVSGVLLSSASYAQTTLYGITNANAMFTMSSTGSPSSVGGPYAISGVASGQALIALDSRPSTGGLYALGYDSTSHTAQLYLINHSGTSYTASAVGSATTAMDLGLNNSAAFDFVSTADNQVRVIGRNGNNYMMNADNGSVMTTGTAGLSFAAGDLYSGAGAMAATAYTNSFYGADASDEVGFDAVNNVLVKMDAGNYSNSFNNASNTMHSIGIGTGLLFDVTGNVGMDTWYDTTTHTNTVFMTGNSILGGAHLYKYNMSGVTGTMTDLGVIGSGSFNVRDIAFETDRDSTSAIMGQLMTGLSLNQRNLVYFDTYNPRNIRRVVRLNGMTSGQTMIGIDYSATGILYGMGYNSSAHNYQLYTIDSATGHVTAVNSTPVSLNLGTDDGSGNYINGGFRFIPTSTNRIRVMGNGTVNSQIDATTGMIAENDTAMNYVTGDASFGATANISTFAYTGYNGDGSTQMMGYDASTGAMVSFDAADNTSGYGNGSSGYMNTGLSLTTTLSLLAHTSGYNNAAMNFMYDNATSSNLGFITANYFGDSSTNQENYSVLYDMSGMLTAYHRTTSPAPTQAGGIGYGVPVRDIAVRRQNATEGVAIVNNNTTNDLLVYPNPTQGYTRVVLDEVSTGPVSVYIIDMNGRIDRSYQFGQGTYQADLDMSALPTGLYSVRVSGDGIGLHNLKVIKE